MDRYEDSMFNELGFEEAEGAADSFNEYDEADGADGYDAADEADGYDEADGADEADGYEEADGYDAADGADGYDAADGADEADGYEEADGFEESEESDDEAWDEVMAHALAAEDSDEFFRRIMRGVRSVAGAVRRAAPMIGKIARAVGPVASLIPGVGTAIGGVANVVGQLMADEASEDETAAAFAELAVRNRTFLPLAVVASARRVLGPAAAHMPQAARVQAIRTLRRAATQLISSAGPTAIRALPRIATSVRRTSITRHTPPSARPRVVAGTAQRLVRRQPRLRRQLTRPLIAGRRVLQRATAAVRAGRPPSRALRIGRAMGGSYGSPTSWGGGYAPGGYGQGGGYASSSRRIVIRGPVTISIRPR